jgi:ATP adenylyltransferase
MKRLFTPWRLDYLKSHRDDAACLFCRVWESREDRENLVLHRGDAGFVIINLYPYNSGHLMVVPGRHIGRLAEATPEERGEVMEMVTWCESVLTEAYSPQGMNIGVNLGRAAGAGIADHLHVHLVPRWSGDTNFATVIGETRIVPETPAQTYESLALRFAGQFPGPSS